MGGIIMNENLNLCEILKDCPTGTKLWSSVWGDVFLIQINNIDAFAIILSAVGFSNITLRSDGKMFDIKEAECIIFPSKDQRDWSKFKVPVKRFNPEEFKPFDKVLIKPNYECERWACNFFSHMLSNSLVSCIGTTTSECIPYNDETKHLLGTIDECPEFYKWWKE